MLTLTKIEEIVGDQLQAFQNKPRGVLRDIDFNRYLKTEQITVISGIRRGGKSTLLAQFADHYDNFYYINFDDERLLEFTAENFDALMTAWRKRVPARVIFLDEIQNVAGWERFARRAHDEGYKIFLTGSNARLLSSELGTRLTGRYFKIELYPFSFKEFLRFKNTDWQGKTSLNRALVLRHFDEYLEHGGFPEWVKYQDIEFLQRIYEDILYRDLLTRFKIREIKAFKQLANFLFTNFTQELSYNSLKNILGFKSVMSVRNYLGFITESFLAFELYKYDYSLKKQFVADKKVYVIDNGLRNAVSFRLARDAGKLLENLVFVELKRRGAEVYYFKDRRECDFAIKEKNKITSLAQVTFALSQENRNRELAGLKQAMERLGLRHGFVLTKEQEEIIRDKNTIITVKPVWKWLLKL